MNTEELRTDAGAEMDVVGDEDDVWDRERMKSSPPSLVSTPAHCGGLSTPHAINSRDNTHSGDTF